MAIFQSVVSSYKKTDGTRNIMICVFHNGQKRYPKTNFFLDKDDLTRSLKVKNQLYIDKINNILKKCRDCCNQYADVIVSFDIQKAMQLVEPIITGNDDTKNKFELDFIGYGRDYVEKLRKNGRTGNAKTYEIVLNNLVKYIDSETINIHEIIANFLRKWINWIKENSKGGRVESFSAAINGKNINKTGLKKIGDEIGVGNLQFYAARHSWATIAHNDCGIDKYTIHEALNHATDLAASCLFRLWSWRKYVSLIVNGN
ncbi:MAG: site-specific integrase [Paludibacter sp.]|nr:site-specific integrase [Paludibacter sp.]